MKLLLSLMLALRVVIVLSPQIQGQEEMPEYLSLSMGLKGPIRHVHSVTTILADNQEQIEDIDFDQQGYKVLLVRRPYKSQGEIQKETYTYDERHNLIKKEEDLGSDKYVSYRATYDKKGFLTEVVRFEPEYDDSRRSVYFYETKGLKEKSCEYNLSDNNPVACLKYSYDSEGRVQNIDHIGEGERVFSREEYKYDRNGRVRSQADYLCSEGSCHFAGDEIFDYGRDGQMTLWRKHSADGSLIFEKTRQQLLGDTGWLETTIDSPPNKLVKTMESFNSFGDITLSVTMDKESRIIAKEVYRYRYDKHGNWILQRRLVCDPAFTGNGKGDCKEASYTSRKMIYYK